MAKLHSRGTAYFLLALMAAAMEMVFGWRASVMYEHFLAAYVGYYELISFRIVVFLGVAVGGYVLATHRQYGAEAIMERMVKRSVMKSDRDREMWAIVGAIAVIVIHDWAGVIYTVFEGHDPDFISVVVTIGMCAFCLLPFLLGHMMLALAESINAERDESYDKKIDSLDKKTRIKAAEELVNRGEDRSAEDRLKQGIRGLLPSSTSVQEVAQANDADYAAFQAWKQQQEQARPLAMPELKAEASQNGNGH